MIVSIFELIDVVNYLIYLIKIKETKIVLNSFFIYKLKHANYITSLSATFKAFENFLKSLVLTAH